MHRENDPSRYLDYLSAVEEKIPGGMTNSSPHLFVEEAVTGEKVSTPTHQRQMKRARIGSIGPIHPGRTLHAGVMTMICPNQKQRNHRCGWMKSPSLRRHFHFSDQSPSQKNATAEGSLSWYLPSLLQ